MIEEAPSVYLDESTRQEMFSLALKATERLNYRGAGTFEFLYQGPGRYYFMEMNTRIQVEHAVTEERAGIDLISAQLALAFGTSIQAIAHHEQPVVAIEARVLAKTLGKLPACTYQPVLVFGSKRPSIRVIGCHRIMMP
ncbi:acetyl-CoA carboxylase, biotin carboxylase [Fructobacillus tropaeoli]|uniref:Acetyl-CoA carboxylase, biotin carboxylase n=1 Tax=Fructobacillus tropaeoli TaxID=709323 RepID=A0A3F3H6Y8_9LACO|nr:acetyl-CoA carboxylase, biotin carboxylase [Fructobacillus tropaeoli]